MGDAKSFYPLLDGQRRRGSDGDTHTSDLSAEVEGGNSGQSGRESSEGLVTGQDDP